MPVMEAQVWLAEASRARRLGPHFSPLLASSGAPGSGMPPPQAAGLEKQEPLRDTTSQPGVVLP